MYVKPELKSNIIMPRFKHANISHTIACMHAVINMYIIEDILKKCGQSDKPNVSLCSQKLKIT